MITYPSNASPSNLSHSTVSQTLISPFRYALVTRDDSLVAGLLTFSGPADAVVPTRWVRQLGRWWIVGSRCVRENDGDKFRGRFKKLTSLEYLT